MQPSDVLETVRRQPKGRTSLKNLARIMHVKGSARVDLEQALDELVEQGQLLENRTGHYRIPGSDAGYVEGRFSQHPAGYGFLQPDRPIPGIDGDVYIGRDGTGDAMHGDRVLAKLVRVGADGRAEGKIRRIVHREQATVVGRFRFGRQGSTVDPHDERVRGPIEIIPGREVPPPSAFGERLGNVKPPRVNSADEMDGMIVNVVIDEFPGRFHNARGRVIEVLGREDDFGVDVETTIRKFHLPYRFSEEALDQAKSTEETVSEEEIAARRDFRELPIVTIDGETARDFDDAVHVEKLSDGRYALQVHIADVSHYVRPGSPLDKDARLRGTSAYFPDRAVPMLPARLSTNICSLNPSVDRLTLSALMEIDDRGEIVKKEFCRGVIRSARRMTYTNVFRALEGDEEVCREYAALVDRFHLMRELAEILIGKRRRRGSIDLDLPEAEIQFDETGRMTGVRRSERNIAHRIIEEFMLAANEAVAARLEEAGYLSLHRVHEPPSGKSIMDFEQIARQFGHSLGIDTGPKTFTRSRKRRDGTKGRRETRAFDSVQVSSHALQQLAEGLKGRPEERVLSYRLLRSLKQARYSEEAKGHFALATHEYTHFTSPIRRYPDLVVHRVLKSLLDSKGPSPYAAKDGKGPYSLTDLAFIADHSSLTERRAADAERELIDWKKAKFMEERLGDEFTGVVVSAMEPGLWIELEDLFIEGFAPAEFFPGERFYYNEKLRALVGVRSKTQYGLGDKVRVRVDRVSFDRMKPEFTCLGKVKRA